MRPNIATDEGRALGAEMARLCDGEVERQGRDGRCGTCAFRAGDHLANGSVETLMSAVKCVAEREPFWCHEHDRPCAGWQLMRFDTDATVTMPWDHVAGVDDIDAATGCADDQIFVAVPVDLLRRIADGN